MRQFLTSLLATACLVGIVMQFERPSAQAVAVSDPAPTFTEPAPPIATNTAPANKLTTTAPSRAIAPVRYVWGKIKCDASGCTMGWKPVTDSASGTNCNCGCGCSSCNCGYHPVQQADPVRRSFFGRRYSGRGLFGGRLFSGRLMGRGCCR